MLPPATYRTVKQPRDSKICLAAVAAMVTGHELADVEAAMQQTPLADGSYYYRSRHFLAYIGGQGIHCGSTFVVDTDQRHDDFTLPAVDSLVDRPAVLVIDSTKFRGATHVLFWDGQCVRDSDPTVADERPLRDYVVREIWPLVYLDEQPEMVSLLERYGRISVSPVTPRYLRIRAQIYNRPPHEQMRAADYPPWIDRDVSPAGPLIAVALHEDIECGQEIGLD